MADQLADDSVRFILNKYQFRGCSERGLTICWKYKIVILNI